MARTPYIPKEKPAFPYERPYSWSQHSSFKYSPRQWYEKYVLDQKTPPSPEMLFGNICGNLLASTPEYLPEVERATIFEQELHGKVGDIELIGFLDSFCPEKKVLLEYKTSRNKKTWNHASANSHDQITFYAFLIHQNLKIKPEDLIIKLVYIPTHVKDSKIELSGEPIQTFNIKKTMTDILVFANEIKETRQKMLDYYNSK